MRVFAEQIRRERGGRGGNLSRQRHVIEIIDKIYASSPSGTAQPSLRQSPPPLWGRVRVGGRLMRSVLPPTPTLPHKGEGAGVALV